MTSNKTKDFHAELTSLIGNFTQLIQNQLHFTYTSTTTSTNQTAISDSLSAPEDLRDSLKSDLALMQDHLNSKKNVGGIIEGVEALLSLLSELKQSLLLNEVTLQNALLIQRKKVLSQQTKQNNKLFLEMLKEFEEGEREVLEAMNLSPLA